jgi:hypothetical protein
MSAAFVHMAGLFTVVCLGGGNPDSAVNKTSSPAIVRLEFQVELSLIVGV